MKTLPDKLVLIDGDCNFCHSTVKWIERNSLKKDFYYSNIQSELGQEIYRQYKIPSSVDSILYIEYGKLYLHSSAALMIARRLKFPINLLAVFLIIPAFLRNLVYRLIARYRYRFFGKKEVCELPDLGFTKRVLQ